MFDCVTPICRHTESVNVNFYKRRTLPQASGLECSSLICHFYDFSRVLSVVKHQNAGWICKTAASRKLTVRWWHFTDFSLHWIFRFSLWSASREEFNCLQYFMQLIYSNARTLRHQCRSRRLKTSVLFSKTFSHIFSFSFAISSPTCARSRRSQSRSRLWIDWSKKCEKNFKILRVRATRFSVHTKGFRLKRRSRWLAKSFMKSCDCCWTA